MAGRFLRQRGPEVSGAEWQGREVYGHVSPDAVSISIWVRYHPRGSAWVAEPSFGIDENAADDTNVRGLIRKFADLRNADDGHGLSPICIRKMANTSSVRTGKIQ